MSASLGQLATLTGSWALDPARSSVQLTSKAMGLFPVRGRFREVSGTGTIGPDGQASGTLTMAAASIDTGLTRRDTHLRSADFFDSDQHPDITFTAQRVRPAGPGAGVIGALTVRGTTRPLSFEAAVSAPAEGEIVLDTTVPVNRADFGLTWNMLGMTAMLSTVTVHAVFVARPGREGSGS